MPSRAQIVLNRLATASFLILTGAGSTRAEDWPAWRGVTGLGVSSATNLPLHWSRASNVVWRTALPEPGNSTPVIWRGKVFVTQAVGHDRYLLCFDQANGRELWRNGARAVEREPTHESNPQASASPATDGAIIVAFFGSAGLYAFDFNGRELWHRELGALRHIWGYGASPALYGGFCFLNFGPGERSFLVAVEKRTGKTVWQHDEPNGASGDAKDGAKPQWIGSWSTPVIIQENGRDALIQALPQRLVSFNPQTGATNWICRGLNDLAYASPLHGAGIVLGLGGFNGMALGVRTGGSGDVTDSHRLWHQPRTRQRIGSGVVHDGHCYILTDPGVAECFEIATGRMIWEQTLQGPASTKQNWSSVLLAGDRLYAINQGGDCFVWRASPQFELLAINSLGEKSNSSIAPAGGQLLIRTHRSLWCIGQAQK